METHVMLETWQVVVLTVLFIGGLVAAAWGIHKTPSKDSGF